VLQVRLRKNHRHPSVLEAAHHLRKALGERRRHAFERLVQQEQAGAAHQRPGERGELLLPARKLRALARSELADFGNVVEDLAQPRAGVRHAGRPSRQQDVLLHGQVGDQASVFRHVADAQARACVRRHREQVLALEAHTPAAGLEQPHHRLDERGLAGAVAADEAGHRACGQLERHAA